MRKMRKGDGRHLREVERGELKNTLKRGKRRRGKKFNQRKKKQNRRDENEREKEQREEERTKRNNRRRKTKNNRMPRPAHDYERKHSSLLPKSCHINAQHVLDFPEL